MSGGAFNYLYSHDAQVTIVRDESMIRAAANALSEEGAADISADLLEFLDYARSVQAELQSRWEKFSPVLRALEWDYSADALDSVTPATEQYRANKLATT